MITKIIYKTVDMPVGYFSHDNKCCVYHIGTCNCSVGTKIDELFEKFKNETKDITLYIFKLHVSDYLIQDMLPETCPHCNQKLPIEFNQMEFDKYKESLKERITFIIK